jgi:hypothetical protein
MHDDLPTREEKAEKMRRWYVISAMMSFMDHLGVCPSDSDEELAAAYDLWIEWRDAERKRHASRWA